MIQIGIIEDDEMIRQSLVDYFIGEAGIEVNLDAASVEHFLSALQEDPYFDIILSDISLPGISGIDGVRLIKKGVQMSGNDALCI